MRSPIRLLSIDFDGTLVSRATEPVFNSQCMELIRELQDTGAIWAINTGRSVDLLEKGLAEFALPIRPDFILTTERDVFRPGQTAGNGNRSAIGTSDARGSCRLVFVCWFRPG
jgi:Predicted hydrolases of the HAD superfamily